MNTGYSAPGMEISWPDKLGREGKKTIIGEELN